MGLNVLVDSFVAVRPGAERSDHILAAVIPLILLAAAVWLYPRMRPGLRACVALLFGALALVWGGLAGAATVQEGGLVCLITCCFSYLRVSPSRRRPASVALAQRRSCALLAAGALSDRRSSRRLLGAAPVGHSGLRHAQASGLGGGGGRDARLQGGHPDHSDGLEFRAWYIPCENGAAVVTFPRETTVPHALMLAEAGYGVLDGRHARLRRQRGRPQRLRLGLRQDIDAAVAYLVRSTEMSGGSAGWVCRWEASR